MYVVDYFPHTAVICSPLGAPGHRRLFLIGFLSVQDLEPNQLVLFIQSFGIPVASMSRLLAALDAAVACSLPAVQDAVLDKSHKAYMAQVCAHTACMVQVLVHETYPWMVRITRRSRRRCVT